MTGHDGMTGTDGIEVRRLAPALGAEVRGVDSIAPMTVEEFAVVRQALLDHGVICIRGQQDRTSEGQLGFAAKWGDISVHPYVPSIDGYPGIMQISGPTAITQTWHADTTHMEQPPACTLLLARTVPAIGGDTMFASATAAFAALSPGLQDTLRGLAAVHQGTTLAADAGLDADAVVAVHPVVRTHPETGQEAIFVNGNYVHRFDGWTAEESAPLLSLLYSVIGRPENVYRHRWQPGDLVVWDNRATQHAVVGDTGDADRVLHRITIAGDTPV